MSRLIGICCCLLLLLTSLSAQHFQGGSAITLTVSDGVNEGWIRAVRTCPNGNSCDNGRGGFSSHIERSPNIEKLGTNSGTFYVAHSATVRATASLTDGTVPTGHYLKIYWQGYPKDEDPACKATSGSECSSSRQVAPVGTPYAPIVCAAFGYESGGTNLGDGLQTVCVNLAYGAGSAAPSFLGGRAMTLTINDGRHEAWIRVTRSCPNGNSCDHGRGGFSSQIDRSANLPKLGSQSGSFVVAHSATIRATATLTDGSVPSGHFLKIYWQGYPKDEDPACKATSGSTCSSSRQVAPPGTPYAPIVCAAFGYESGGTNLGDGYQNVCISLGYPN